MSFGSNPIPLSIHPVGHLASHAQNLSTTKLQQHIDREQAKVSVDQMIRKTSSQPASTSIYRAMNADSAATTSILRKENEQYSMHGENEDQEIRDRLRYQHIRKLIKERKEAEAQAVQVAPTVAKASLSFGTGVSFSRKIRGGFNKVFSKRVRYNPATYKNISKADKQFLGDLIQKHATARRTGVGYSYGDRKRMKMDVEQAKRKGTISYDDSKDMKRIISNLS